MVFYSFYTDRFRDESSLVYRSEDIEGVANWSPLQVNMKMFDSKHLAELDFFSLLSDNEDLRIGEYFDTDKKKSKPQKEKTVTSSESKSYNSVPSNFKLELNKVYNLDCMLFMKQLPDKYLNYIFTSPPYNIKKQIGSDDLYKEYSDDLTPDEYFDWLSAIIDEGLRVTKMHFFMNIQMLGKNKEVVLGIFGKYKKLIKDRMIWKKTIVAPHIQQGILNSGFEDIIIFSNDRPHLKKFSDANWKQGTMSNVIEGLNASRNKHSDLNKATFPMYLPRIFMINFGKEGDIWYDPFNGTGTTSQGAVIEKKRWLATEIDINQCVVTDQRIDVEENALKFDFGERLDMESDIRTDQIIEINKHQE